MVSPGQAESFSPPEHRDRIFALILMGTLCGQMGLSILTPFFPAEAKAKRVSPPTLGWIFSVFQLATMVFAPLASRLLVKFGSKPMLVASNLIGGVANIMQAFCWYANEGPFFVTASLVLRVLAGLAYSFQSTAGYSLLSSLFGPTVSTAAGKLEGANGLALILGPLVGSTLFSIGGGAQHVGYVIPFLVLGLTGALCGGMNWVLMPTLPTPARSNPSLSKFSLKAVPTAINCTILGIVFGVLNPTLQPHCAEQPLKYDVQIVGLVYATICAIYSMLGILVGRLDDLYEGRNGFLLMAIGALLIAVSFFLLGPLELAFGSHFVVEMKPSPALFWISVCIMGAGAAFGWIPVYRQFVTHALHTTSEERDLRASMIYTISVALGSFLGPVVGGLLSQHIGVRGTYTYTGVMALMLFLMLMLLAIGQRSETFKKSRDPPLLTLPAPDDALVALR